MAKVDGSLKSLLQGVSQQPARDRLPGQATLQENMSSDPITGLTRRPATDLVNKLLTSAEVRGWHDFNIKDGTKFIAMFTSTDVKVYDLNGVEKTVTKEPAAMAYLLQAGVLRFSTIENDTYVVNRGKVVEMTDAERVYYNDADRRQVFIIQVLGGQYGRNYNVKINDVQYASFTVADGSVANHIDQTRTKYIASQLYSGLPATMAGATWTKVLRDDIIVLYTTSTADFTITVNDDFGNTNIKANGMTVARQEDLPRFAPHNMIVRVAEKTDPETDLWFRFIVEGQEDNWDSDTLIFGQQGYWQEAVAPDTPTTFDKNTMPHMLRYYNDGTFRFQQVDWADRAVGTTTSNPDPSFVDNRITDVGSFQGRLVLTSGPNVIMSRSNREQDFWFGSASAQNDSDPIDVRSKVEASTMQAIIQHNRDLVIFSNKGQFIVYGRTALTPQNAALVLTSAFEAELQAKPVGAGRNVFFATNFGSYTGIREFFVESGTDINDSRAITQHVKRYVEGRVTKLSASSNYDTLIVQTDKDERELYWYQYIWTDTEKVQSSWSKLIMQSPVKYVFFDEETVYIVQQDGTDYYLTRMSLDVQNSLGMDYHVHLDNRFDVFEVSRQFVLPYDYLRNQNLVAVQGPDCPTPGLTVPIESIEYDPEYGYVVTLKRDMLGGDIVVGSTYRSRYMPTMPQVKDRDGVKVGTGNFVISKFRVSLSATGEIIGQTLSRYGDGPEVRFNARIVGYPDNQVGIQPLSDDEFSMPFSNKVDLAEVQFYTASHLPMTMLDIEWEGQYMKRGRRISTSSEGG